MKKDPQAKWESATVVAKHETPRLFMVKTPEGMVYRRNHNYTNPRLWHATYM